MVTVSLCLSIYLYYQKYQSLDNIDYLLYCTLFSILQHVLNMLWICTLTTFKHSVSIAFDMNYASLNSIIDRFYPVRAFAKVFSCTSEFCDRASVFASRNDNGTIDPVIVNGWTLLKPFTATKLSYSNPIMIDNNNYDSQEDNVRVVPDFHMTRYGLWDNTNNDDLC